LHVTGKGSKDRVVPIGEWVIPYALEYLHTARPWLVRLTKTDLLFPSCNGRLLDGQALGWIIRTYTAKAGLTMRITPHTMRHACATHMIQEGADIRYVQELLGHEDLNSTQIYTRVTIGDLKKAHLKYHPANKDEFRDEPTA
jgi:integrase/recombinase XerD